MNHHRPGLSQIYRWFNFLKSATASRSQRRRNRYFVDAEILESRQLLTASFGFDYTVIASDLSPTLRFFAPPNTSGTPTSDAPFTILRYGEGQVTSLHELGVGYLEPMNLTFTFGSNDQTDPVEAVTLAEFDNGLNDGIVNQIYRPDANDQPKMTIYNSGVAFVEGRVQEISLAMPFEGGVSSARSKFIVDRAVGSDTRLFDELVAASQGTNVIPFNLSEFDIVGPWAGVGDAMVFESTGVSLFTAPANRAPTNISLSSNTIAENQPTGTVVSTLTSTDPDGSGIFTYSLVAGVGSTDNASFVISGDQLKANAAFDFETKSSYSVRLETRDPGGLAFEKQFSIQVSDISENNNTAPTNISLSQSSVSENQPPGTAVGLLSTTDPDGAGNFTYSLVSGVGSTDNASFDIAFNQLRTKSSFDFETKSSYTIRIQTRDPGGLTFQKQFTIRVADVPENNAAPTDITLSPSSVRENQPAGVLAGTLTTTDPNSTGNFVYTLVSGTGDSGNSQFSVFNNRLLTNAPLNFEAKPSYSIRIQTRDSGGLIYQKQLAVQVTNVVEINLSAASIEENRPPGSLVGTLTPVPADVGQRLGYSLVSGNGATDNASFVVVGNRLHTARSFNYEENRSFSIRLQAKTRDSRVIREEIFTITVKDVEERPSAPTDIRMSNSMIDENRPTGTVVGTFTSSDADGGTFTYRLVPGQRATDNSQFVIIGNELRTTSAFDFEVNSSYRIYVQSTDETALSKREYFTVGVRNVNEAPTQIRVPDLTIAENTTSSRIQLRADDPDRGESFNWSLTVGQGDNNNALFSMTSTGVLAPKFSPDFEQKSSYTVRVRVTDSAQNTLETVLIIGVRDVAEEDEYLVGDWNGDGRDTFAVRRGNRIIYQPQINSAHGIAVTYGNGNSEDQYLVGDWDGDGKDTLAVRRGNQIVYQSKIHFGIGTVVAFGNGSAEDQYLVGDWDGDGKDTLAVRRGNKIYYQATISSSTGTRVEFGNGNSESLYLVGDWDGDGRDTLAVRRENKILYQSRLNSSIGTQVSYGNGSAESQYLVGDWDRNRTTTLAVRRHNRLLYQKLITSALGDEVTYGDG